MFNSLDVDTVRMLAMGFAGLIFLAAMVGALYWYFANQKDKRIAESGILPGPKQSREDENMEEQVDDSPKFSFESAVGSRQQVATETEKKPKKGLFSFGSKKKPAESEAILPTRNSSQAPAPQPQAPQHGQQPQQAPTPQQQGYGQPQAPQQAPTPQLRRPTLQRPGAGTTSQPARPTPQLKKPQTPFNNTDDDDVDW